MSFLIDGPWLYATGDAYARLASPEERRKNAAKRAATTIAGFYAVSIPLYLNQRWTKPIWKACRAESGRDWMINSGVLRIDADEVGPRGHKIAAALFATYPLWLWLGYRNARRGIERRAAERAARSAPVVRTQPEIAPTPADPAAPA